MIRIGCLRQFTRFLVQEYPLLSKKNVFSLLTGFGGRAVWRNVPILKKYSFILQDPKFSFFFFNSLVSKGFIPSFFIFFSHKVKTLSTNKSFSCSLIYQDTAFSSSVFQYYGRISFPGSDFRSVLSLSPAPLLSSAIFCKPLLLSTKARTGLWMTTCYDLVFTFFTCR